MSALRGVESNCQSSLLRNSFERGEGKEGRAKLRDLITTLGNGDSVREANVVITDAESSDNDLGYLLPSPWVCFKFNAA